MKGIIDTQALSMYKEDFNESIKLAIESESPELNIHFLEYRYKMLKEQADILSKKREEIKAEIEKTMARLGGELFTINQMLKYTLKEEGACEFKIEELKEMLNKEVAAKTAVNE